MKGERGWCVEHYDSQQALFYLTATNGLFGWSLDSLKAIRFSRREDAEVVANVIGDEVDKVAEHEWLT